MKIKCPYCGTMFDDTLARCPRCSAPSEGVVRTAKSQPITIEQLQQWYADRGLPPYETTRFFIGIDYREPRAFGIYRDEDTGNFVVYKNLADGQRKIRYEGTDEAYAVNELYMRLKQEIIQQKSNAAKKKQSSTGANAPRGPRPGNTGRKRKIWPFILLAVLVFVGLCVTLSLTTDYGVTPCTGYYQYDGTNYYHAAFAGGTEDWYYYDDYTDQWEPTYDELPTDLTDNDSAKDFYYTPLWDSSTQVGDFDEPSPFTDSEYAAQYASDGYSSTTGSQDDDWDDGWDNYNDDSDYDWDAGDTWDSWDSDWDTGDSWDSWDSDW